ncbi:hypothetical protein [Paenibacillus sp. HW567]|uniref:hypothetical protein n=1 Tax=Paenibacillus sp. HW567 TaxID=1034769 RepID=UPI0003802B2E|nr:hypothetical protein [Paenibacillus sp. HW567]
MKRQYNILSISAVALLVVSFMALSNNKAEDSVQYINSSAKVISYADFNELDTSAELIIKGTKDHVVETILNKNPKGEVLSYGTQSAIKVNKVFKSDNKNIEVGSEIIVQENGAMNKTQEGTFVYGIEGYQLMNENEEYLLFLDKSLTDSNIYFVKGVYYGKVPLKDTTKIQYQGETTEKLEQIFKEALINIGSNCRCA